MDQSEIEDQEYALYESLKWVNQLEKDYLEKLKKEIDLILEKAFL